MIGKEKKKQDLPEQQQPAEQEKVEQPETAPEDEMTRLTRELAEQKDKYLRLAAEFDNARKRADRDRVEFIKYANEGLIIDFLGVMDDLERSIQAAQDKHEDYQAFLKGIEMVMAHIYELLKKNGVKPIEAKGHRFDPHCHEIMMQEPSAEAEEQTVLEEFQKGYFLGEKVVRTAKVKVAVKSAS